MIEWLRWSRVPFACAALSAVASTGCYHIAAAPALVVIKIKETNDERLAFNRAEYARREGELFSRFRYAGKLESGDVLPAGRLYVDLNSIAADVAGTKRAQLTLNLDQPLPAPDYAFERGRSYVVATTMNCTSGTLSIESTLLTTIEDGFGRQVNLERHSPPLAVNKPGSAMAAAVTRVCGN